MGERGVRNAELSRLIVPIRVVLVHSVSVLNISLIIMIIFCYLSSVVVGTAADYVVVVVYDNDDACSDVWIVNDGE